MFKVVENPLSVVPEQFPVDWQLEVIEIHCYQIYKNDHSLGFIFIKKL